MQISRDEIELTFGGSDRSRGYYSSVYARCYSNASVGSLLPINFSVVLLMRTC